MGLLVTSYLQVYLSFYIPLVYTSFGRRGGLVVSALDSGIERSGFEPWPGHCVVFLGKTLSSHSASLHPGSLPARCDGLVSHPGGVAIHNL